MLFADGAAFRSDMAESTVKDGKLDKEIVLYVGEKDKARSVSEKNIWKKRSVSKKKGSRKKSN